MVGRIAGFCAAVMATGIWSRTKPLRLTALAIVALTAAKIFLVDMADLVGCGGWCRSSAWD